MPVMKNCDVCGIGFIAQGLGSNLVLRCSRTCKKEGEALKQAEYMVGWRARNKEANARKSAEWRARNKEAVAEYRARNKEAIARKNARWEARNKRKRNAEAEALRHAEYRARNRELIRKRANDYVRRNAAAYKVLKELLATTGNNHAND